MLVYSVQKRIWFNDFSRKSKQQCHVMCLHFFINICFHCKLIFYLLNLYVVFVISWSMWLLHRLCSHSLVPGPWAAGGRHSVWASCGCVGDWLCVRWAAVRHSSVAWEVRHGPTVPDQKDSWWVWKCVCREKSFFHIII